MNTSRLQQTMIPAMVLACLLGMGPHDLKAFPTPSIVPTSWELHFTHSTPKAIAIEDFDGRVKWYWYLTYRVTNNSGSERLFVPEAAVATQEGDIITAGRNVPTRVFEAIKKQVGNHLLETPTKIIGKILQGPDHAKDGVIIWPVIEHDVSHISIFLSGLSGEALYVKNPGGGSDVLLSKTLMIDYDLPGKAPNPQDQTLKHTSTKWVMR